MLSEAQGDKGTPIIPIQGEKDEPDMTGFVVVEAILRTAEGFSILDVKEAITADNISKYQVGKEVTDEVSRKLEELGFKVEQVGPTSVTISGDKKIFESVFQTSLEIHAAEIMDTKVEGIEAQYYEAAEPLMVPDELSSLIAAVVLPTPPEFFP